MVWEKGHKLACVSLHHPHREYGCVIWGNWYLNFQKGCSQERSGRKYRELLSSLSIELYIIWCTIQIYRKTKIWTMTISDFRSRFRQLNVGLLLAWYWVRTLVHIFDACDQDWFAVASVLESVASERVRMEPGVNELFLRNDSAGCCHNAALLTSAAVLIARQGLVLKD